MTGPQFSVGVHMAPTGTVAQMLRGETLAWIDVSRWVSLDAGVEFGRGVSSDGITPDTGTLTVSMRNDDGAWSPGRNVGDVFAQVVGAQAWAGQYADQVTDSAMLTGVPIRVCHLRGEGHAVLWSGAVTGRRLAWANGHRPVVRLSCADPVATLERTVMRSLPVEMTVNVGNARWCYPLAGSGPQFSSVAPGTDMPRMSKNSLAFPLEGNTLEFEAWPSPGSHDGEGEYEVPVWTGGGVHVGWALDTGNSSAGRTPGLSSQDGFTLHAMVRPEGLGRARYAMSWVGRRNTIISIGVSAVNQPVVYINLPTPGAVVAATVPTMLLTGQWHHIAIRVSGDATTSHMQVWVNGVPLWSSSGSWLIDEVEARRIVAGARVTPSGALIDIWQGSVAVVAGHDGYVPSLVLQRIAAGRYGWAGDDTCGRLNRILYAAGYDRSALPEGASTMSPQHTADASIADALDDCSHAERAPWWVTRDGTPTMGPRSSRWEAATVATVHADALGRELEFAEHSADRRTVVTVTRPGGSSITRRNPLADQIGDIGGDVSLMLDSDAQLEVLADEMVSRLHARPAVATESVSVDVVRSGAAVDVGALLDVDVEQVVELVGLPTSAPWASRRMLVRRIADRIGTDSWLRTLTVVDAPELIDVFRVDQDELDGVAVLGW